MGYVLRGGLAGAGLFIIFLLMAAIFNQPLFLNIIIFLPTLLFFIPVQYFIYSRLFKPFEEGLNPGCFSDQQISNLLYIHKHISSSSCVVTVLRDYIFLFLGLILFILIGMIIGSFIGKLRRKDVLSSNETNTSTFI